MAEAGAEVWLENDRGFQRNLGASECRRVEKAASGEAGADAVA